MTPSFYMPEIRINPDSSQGGFTLYVKVLWLKEFCPGVNAKCKGVSTIRIEKSNIILDAGSKPVLVRNYTAVDTMNTPQKIVQYE